MYAVDFNRILLTGELSSAHKSEWTVKPCMHGWEYNYTEVPYVTAASEVCDLKVIAFNKSDDHLF